MSTRTNTSFNFLGLPPELRLQIYEYVEAARVRRKLHLFGGELYRLVQSPDAGNLRLTCYQINADFVNWVASKYLSPYEQAKRSRDYHLVAVFDIAQHRPDRSVHFVAVAYFVAQLIRSRTLAQSVPNEFQNVRFRPHQPYSDDLMPSFPSINMQPQGQIFLSIILPSGTSRLTIYDGLVEFTRYLLLHSPWQQWLYPVSPLNLTIVMDYSTWYDIEAHTRHHPYRLMPAPNPLHPAEAPCLGPWEHTMDVGSVVNGYEEEAEDCV